jgi:hypothetical protein
MPEKVAIIQSNYIPWKGYFNIIKNVDAFVFLDDVQFTRPTGEIEISLKHLKDCDG